MVPIALTGVALVIELAWLASGGSTGAVTAIAVGAVAVLVLTRGRRRIVNGVNRVALGLLFAGSVADRFGLLGGPGAAGVSWGDYAAFVDYTRSLLPATLHAMTPVAAVAATVVESVLALALISGVRRRQTAAATAAVLAVFGLAMWSSLGFGAMASYAVPVLCGAAWILATENALSSRKVEVLVSDS